MWWEQSGRSPTRGQARGSARGSDRRPRTSASAAAAAAPATPPRRTPRRSKPTPAASESGKKPSIFDRMYAEAKQSMDDPLAGIDLEKHGLDRQVLETREQTRLLKEQMRREQRAADEIAFREEREQVPSRHVVVVKMSSAMSSLPLVSLNGFAAAAAGDEEA